MSEDLSTSLAPEDPIIKDAPADPMAEVTAMSAVATALSPLSKDGARRVLVWAADHYGLADLSIPSRSEVQQKSHLRASATTQVEEKQEEPEEFGDIADLFAALDARSDSERALVAAYWFQHLEGMLDFDSATLNKELKHLGHKASNITTSLSSLMSKKPQLVIQTRKSGTSQQARKRYKLTNEGIKQVQRMLNSEVE